MNILITGGLGYIGGRLAHFLREKEPNTTLFLTTRDKNKDFPSWLKDNFNVLQMNILDKDSVADCLKGKDIKIIIHLAAINEVDSIKDPELALRINTQGTYTLLNIAKDYGVKNFIYFSTFHVYNDVLSSFVSEESPTRPFHPYAITHRAAEDFVNYFKHYYGMKTLIFRLSNGYGYPMDINVNRWTLVFNDLCRQAVTTNKLILKSSGKQYRDFISLYNTARAVHHFIYEVPDEWGDGLYNLGGNCSMSILEVANKIAEIYKTRYTSEIREITTKADVEASPSPKSVTYSIQKLEKTGFCLEDNFYHEIEKTMELCEEFIR